MAWAKAGALRHLTALSTVMCTPEKLAGLPSTQFPMVGGGKISIFVKKNSHFTALSAGTWGMRMRNTFPMRDAPPMINGLHAKQMWTICINCAIQIYKCGRNAQCAKPRIRASIEREKLGVRATSTRLHAFTTYFGQDKPELSIRLGSPVLPLFRRT